MRRLRRIAWLLWLLIALLPLRGIAMGALAPMAELPAAVTFEQPPPCPLHATASATDATPIYACALCDVCHLVAMPVPEVSSGPADKPQTAPLPSLGLGAGRAPADGLFRPPR